MKEILMFQYELSKHMEYPFGDGCYYSTEWNEIESVYFYSVQKTAAGSYIDKEHLFVIADSTEQLHNETFQEFKDVISKDAYHFNVQEEKQFLMGHLKQQNLDTHENIAQVMYWVMYNNNRWKIEYEQAKSIKRA